MRDAFFRTLIGLAEADASIYLITGDLGFGCINGFVEKFPERFINAGVAEQNMTGLATGMALAGNTVFTYSIGNFATLRCLEQIRNDACYHNANVKVVAVGGGLAYGALGASHHATEDLAILRSLPEIVVVAPGDPLEVEAAVKAIAAHPGPCYLRLGRAGEPNVHDRPPDFHLGKAIQLRDGEDLALVSTGGMLQNTVAVADRLLESGIRATVVSVPTLKPLDSQAILAAARRTRALFTVEEHSVCGGLGGAVAETLCEGGVSGLKFRRLGLPPEFCVEVGNREYLLHKFRLDVDGLEESVLRELDKPIRAPLAA